MKRTVVILSFIFALAIALSVSIPTLALIDTASTTVSGTLAAKVTITANTPTVSLGALPNSALDAVIVTVKCNKAWALAAQAPNMNEGAKILTYALDGKVTGGSTWLNLSTSQALNSGSTKTGSAGIATHVDFNQAIDVGADEPSTGAGYSSIVTFTVTY